MTQQGKTRVANPEDLRSIPVIYMVEEENQLPKCSSTLHMCNHTRTHTNMHMRALNTNEILKTFIVNTSNLELSKRKYGSCSYFILGQAVVRW